MSSAVAYSLRSTYCFAASIFVFVSALEGGGGVFAAVFTAPLLSVDAADVSACDPLTFEYTAYPPPPRIATPITAQKIFGPRFFTGVFEERLSFLVSFGLSSRTCWAG